MFEYLRKVFAETKSNMTAIRSDLAVTRANMVMARADLELEKQKREAKVVATEEKLAKMKREVEAAIERYKTFVDFMIEMAHAVATFQASKEFSDACVTLSHKAFMKAMS